MPERPVSDQRSGTALNASKRYSTRYPGTYYRLDSKGNRRYQISYTDSAGSRIFKTLPKGTTEKEAVRERNQILERMHRGERVVRTRVTVDDLANQWLPTQETRLKPKTFTGYKYALNHWVLPELGSRKVCELGVADVAEFISHMQKKGYKAHTIRECLKPLSGMFRHAKRKGWMSGNPINELEPTERPKSDQRDMLILSTEEIVQVLAALTETYRPLVQAAVFTGLRANELLAMKWSDVDLSNGIIRVPDSKTRAGIREVMIHDDLVKMFSRFDHTEGLVFRTSNGTPVSQRNLLRALHKALDDCGLEKRGLHALRHTFASILIHNGEDVTYVADQMGHADPAITLRLYVKLFEPQKRRKEARKRMQENFAGVVA